MMVGTNTVHVNTRMVLLYLYSPPLPAKTVELSTTIVVTWAVRQKEAQQQGNKLEAAILTIWFGALNHLLTVPMQSTNQLGIGKSW